MISVRYEDALRELNGEKKKIKRSLFEVAAALVSTRSSKGKYTRELEEAARIRKAKKMPESSRYFRYCISKYLLGKTITEKLFGELSAESKKFRYDLIEYGIEFFADGPLYHFVLAEDVDKVREQGLIPGDKYVFLTHDPEMIPWFPAFKSVQLGRDITLCLVEVDAPAAAKKHKFLYYRTNEIVTDRIESEFITKII